MMKVFFVDVYDPLPNNLYNNLQDVASRKKNCEIDFIGPIGKNNFYDTIKNKDSIKRVWTLNNYVFKIYNYIKSHKPDIVHYQFELRRLGLFKTGIKFPFLLYLSSLTKSKIVVTLHDLYVAKEGSKWTLFKYQSTPVPRFILKILVKLFMKSVGRFSDKIIVYSKIGEKALIEYYGIPQEKIVTSNLALTENTTIQNQEKRKKYELEYHNKKIILHFGSISPRKGYETAINAINIVAKKEPNCLLVITGKTNPYHKIYEQRLRQLPKKLNVEKNVHFTGFLEDEDLAVLFEISEAALYLYKPGSYGSLAIHHAVQHNTPTIATDTEIFREILGDNAEYIDPENERQLAKAMLKIITDEEFKQKIRNEMRKITGKFTWAKTAATTMEVYESLTSSENHS